MTAEPEQPELNQLVGEFAVAMTQAVNAALALADSEHLDPAEREVFRQLAARNTVAAKLILDRLQGPIDFERSVLDTLDDL